MELIDAELAVTWNEAEAKLTEETRPADSAHFPHILTSARRQLVSERHIIETASPTRGGQSVETLSPRDTAGRTTAIEQAAARKRLLASRYLSWATPNSTYKHGVIGPTGEAIIRHALVTAGNLALTTTGAGEVKQIMGMPLPGSLDSGGWLPVMDANEHPAGMVYIPIEVKNIRDWLYPQSSQVFQVLDKAAQLQRHSPNALILPLLICRRVNYTLFFMAKQLGFKVRDNRQQYVRPVMQPEELAEVRTELGFIDLIPTEPNTTPQHLPRFFRNGLPKNALEFAHTWRETVLTHNLDIHFPVLRDNALRGHDRATAMELLRHDAGRAGRCNGW